MNTVIISKEKGATRLYKTGKIYKYRIGATVYSLGVKLLHLSAALLHQGRKAER